MAYSFYRTFTIDATKVGSTDQTNFPVAFYGTYDGTAGEPDLRTVGNGGKVQNANGYDIAFFSDSALTTALKFELVSYTAATGDVEFHIKVPTVSHTINTVIYMAYGDSGISTYQGDTANTWDANFKRVYHLNGNGSTDSTGGQNGTNHNTTSNAGLLGSAESFNGTSSYIDIGTSLSPVTNFTLEALVWTSAVTNSTQIISKGYDLTNTQWQMKIPDAGSLVLEFDSFTSPSTTNGTTSIATLSNSTWYYLVGSFDGTTWKIYINGTLDNSVAEGAPTATAQPLYIGAVDASTFGIVQFWNGLIDEIRISDTAVRSADWILATSNNLLTPSSFYTIGSETSASTFKARKPFIPRQAVNRASTY